MVRPEQLGVSVCLEVHMNSVEGARPGIVLSFAVPYERRAGVRLVGTGGVARPACSLSNGRRGL